MSFVMPMGILGNVGRMKGMGTPLYLDTCRVSQSNEHVAIFTNFKI